VQHLLGNKTLDVTSQFKVDACHKTQQRGCPRITNKLYETANRRAADDILVQIYIYVNRLEQCIYFQTVRLNNQHYEKREHYYLS